MRFPLFIDIKDKRAVVVGGGKIAVRRINILLKFGARIKVVAPNLMADKLEGDVEYIKKTFEPEDIENAFIVVAATGDRAVNHSVCELCHKKNILVSVADCKEESSFYFPAVCLNDSLSIGIVSDGNNHTLVKDMAEKIRRLLDNEKKAQDRQQRK